MISRPFATLLFILSSQLQAIELDLNNCEYVLLASAFFTNNVSIYNGCNGDYLDELDQENDIQGGQAIRRGPDGHIYVVSEKNSRIVRYDGQTLEKIDVFISGSPLNSPTALDFDTDGNLIIGNFGNHRVLKYNGQSGQFIKTLLNTSNQGVTGIDAGMSFGPDGNLYIPGFNSNSALVVDGNNPDTTVLTITNLSNPRVIAFHPTSGKVYISNQGSGAISIHPAGGGPSERVLARVGNITGITFGPDGNLYAIRASNRSVIIQIDPETGEKSDFTSLNDNINGATFLHFQKVASASEPVPDPQVDNANQLWLSGSGSLIGNQIEIELYSTKGGNFGADFDPQAVSQDLWGSLSIELESCDTATMSWNSNSSPAKSLGSYPIQRLVMGSPAAALCESMGFDNTSDPAWINGAWYGGATRSGEGIFIDVLTDEIVFAAWFTYQPVIIN